jgi:hypothetical protein
MATMKQTDVTYFLFYASCCVYIILKFLYCHTTAFDMLKQFIILITLHVSVSFEHHKVSYQHTNSTLEDTKNSKQKKQSQ